MPGASAGVPSSNRHCRDPAEVTSSAMPPNDKENSTMTAEPTGLFQGLAPLLVNRTVIMTVAADGKGLLTLNVIPEKVKDDESDALTTALCITASPEELDRDLPAQLREFTDVHAKAASNIQKVKDELAAAEKAEREAADERRAKKMKGKVVPPPASRDRAGDVLHSFVSNTSGNQRSTT